ncbi:histidine phosphatase superfamily [Chaetomium sp. MPI-SDFR-AT-0129]|nr:histidine phosphatase superfamily [Chaetomium sp. MPI-SDFR-AT-0129]
MATPRVFIVRHGETEWSLNGRHTGSTDIPLTATGEKRVLATGKALVGNDRLIAPSKLAHIYVSPRRRAQRTLELLNVATKDQLPWQAHGETFCEGQQCEVKVEITEDIREWDYGDYEGITTHQIKELRKQQGLDPNWDIWRDGCPGGESPTDISERLDRLIQDIRERWHAPVFGKEKNTDSNATGDVLIVAHGHILRAFAQRWANQSLHAGPSFLLEAGGVGTLSYEHHNIDEPAILLGGAFVVDIPEAQQRVKQ